MTADQQRTREFSEIEERDRKSTRVSISGRKNKVRASSVTAKSQTSNTGKSDNRKYLYKRPTS